VSLKLADDPVRDASAIRVIENPQLTHQLADHKQLLIPVPAGREKRGTAGVQGINARQIALRMAKLLLDGLTDLVDARSLLLGS
jgi:hypothetical protein